MIDRRTNIRAALKRRQRGFLLNPYRFGPGGPTDPSFSNVSLLINPAGADTSTTFADLSSNANTLTAIANAQHDTSITKFTSSSLQCDGTGDFVSAPSGAIFNFDSSNYTLETWFYVTSFAAFSGLMGKRPSSAVFAGFSCGVDTAGNVAYLATANGSSWGVSLSSSTTISTSVWYHLCVDYDGSTTRLYIDGVVRASAAGAFTILTNNNDLAIGAGAGNGDFSLLGHMGPTRITKGVARYAGAFTPPTAEFPTTS